MSMCLLGQLLFCVVEITSGLDDLAPDDLVLDAAISTALASDDPVVSIGQGTLVLSIYPAALRETDPVRKNRDLQNLRITGSGSGTTLIRGVSELGFDVLQLNAVSNLTIDSLAIESIKTGTSSTGCNGISLTNGCRNIVIRDVHVRSLPYVLLADRFDGGKGVTIQTGLYGVEPTDGIVVDRCRVSDCAVGLGLDVAPVPGLVPGTVLFTNNTVERSCLAFYSSFAETSVGLGYVPGCDIQYTGNLAFDCKRTAFVTRTPNLTFQYNSSMTTQYPSIPDPYQDQYPDMQIVVAGGVGCTVTYNSLTCSLPQNAFIAIGSANAATVGCSFLENTLSGPANYGFDRLPGVMFRTHIRDNAIEGCAVDVDPRL